MITINEISHDPWIKGDISLVEDYYSKKEGVNVRYVCTTELNDSNHAFDVYYRETPHPEFGNRYFGLTYNSNTENLYICDADEVENYMFVCVDGDDGYWHYSQYRHDFRSFENGNMIDGGRSYTRLSGGPVKNAKIKDGIMQISP